MANTKQAATEGSRALNAMRNKKLSKQRRSEIARQAAEARWREYRARKEKADEDKETS